MSAEPMLRVTPWQLLQPSVLCKSTCSHMQEHDECQNLLEATCSRMKAQCPAAACATAFATYRQVRSNLAWRSMAKTKWCVNFVNTANQVKAHHWCRIGTWR